MKQDAYPAKTPSSLLTRAQTFTPASSQETVSNRLSAARKRNGVREKARLITWSVWFQLFMLLVIAIDLAFLVRSITKRRKRCIKNVWSVEAFTMGVYTVEICLRFYGFGPHHFVGHWWNLLDVSCYAFAAVVNFSQLVVGRCMGKPLKLLALGSRIAHAVWYIVSYCMRQKGNAQRQVSKNKYRYYDVKDNYDLDLTFITSSLIAMGVPVTGCVAAYFRNPLDEVVRFFRQHYPFKFRIYNLCPELPYPDAPFVAIGGAVVRFRVADHTPPTMAQFVRFLADAREWQSESNENILAVHCKAGKGRTGSFCCAWLMYSRRADTAEDALGMFSRRRTDTRVGNRLQGVETPSQVRYVNNVWRHLQGTNSWLDSPAPPPLCATPAKELHSLDLEGGLLAERGRQEHITLLVSWRGADTEELLLETPLDPSASSVPLGGVRVQGDIRICAVKTKSLHAGAPKTEGCKVDLDHLGGVIFCFFFHTNFMTCAEDAEGAEAGGEPKRFTIQVEDLDHTRRQIKKGTLARGSSVALRYADAPLTAEEWLTRGSSVALQNADASLTAEV